MADLKKSTDGPQPSSSKAFDYTQVPDWDNELCDEDDILAFASALSAPDASTLTSPSEEDLLNPSKKQNAEFITALNDWRPVHQRRMRRQGGGRKHASKKKKSRRGKDETREGWTYTVFKYPLLFFVCGWIAFLGVCYLMTRFYIYVYEHFVTWRGTRNTLRKNLASQHHYKDWVQAAKDLDHHLGNDKWKENDEGSYYDWRSIIHVLKELKKLRQAAQEEEKTHGNEYFEKQRRAIDDLKAMIESCVKFNFGGTENAHLYSEAYFGTKNLLQAYTDETAESLRFLFASDQLNSAEKRQLAKHTSANYGRTALCLSGGATFAYYHFGIGKALLDADLLPTIITGTSGGALVAAVLATRTNEELKKMLVPALAYKIKGCQEPFSVWFKRWWRTGARFDSVDWARRCSWFCHGSLTFLEAYQRTGRILNVSCIPSDPHSPTILANYLTTPDCVIWSAVLASAAVPGILNPVVLMRKMPDGKLEPFSFGHKWKDGSLRTDIPLKSLNLHFNVNFSIVSQVNPHASLWFFSSRGSVGRPVTHRRGRGWRGGFLGSALEQFIKLDLNKWLKVLRHLELLPRPLGQDWSQVFLQRFSGTITVFPKTKVIDFYYILSDPDMGRLAGMLQSGQLATWPKLKFLGNRMAIEKVIEEAREATRPPEQALPTPMPAAAGGRLRSVLSEEDLQNLLEQARGNNGVVEVPEQLLTPVPERVRRIRPIPESLDSPSFTKRVSGWWDSFQAPSGRNSLETVRPVSRDTARPVSGSWARQGSTFEELARQSRVFLDDYESELPSDLEHTQGDEETEEELFSDGDASTENEDGMDAKMRITKAS